MTDRRIHSPLLVSRKQTRNAGGSRLFAAQFSELSLLQAAGQSLQRNNDFVFDVTVSYWPSKMAATGTARLRNGDIVPPTRREQIFRTR